ncbi:MAG: GntR family transcriptional regulator [Ardenticatenaceae bacterium]|nr:GntR family transcriptional regulator [Ardenticatenaceae bacterium]HBY97513.1 hypothetical protein [Chloroflexota bacterium]
MANFTTNDLMPIPMSGHLSTLNPMSKQVYDELLEALITWELHPGDILIESRLAERFNTSRTPIREALKVLAGEGFLKVIPRTGYVVCPVTFEDVHEVAYMRQILEPEAAALTASRIELESVQATLNELERITKELAAASTRGQERIDPRDIYNYNTHFHLSIAHASGIRRLAGAIDVLLKEEARVMFRDRTVKDAPFVTGEHLALLEVIRAGNPDRARLAMKAHVEGNRGRLLESLLSSRSTTLISL